MHSAVCLNLIRMVLISGLVAGTAVGQDEQARTTEKELLAVIEQMVAAQQNFDAAALDQLLADDYVEVSPVGEVDERKEVISFYAPSEKEKSPPATITIGEPHFRLRSNSALVIVRENVAVKVGDQTREMSLRVTLTLRKENEKWLIASAQYTGIRK